MSVIFGKFVFRMSGRKSGWTLWGKTSEGRAEDQTTEEGGRVRWAAKHRGSILASHPAALGSIPSVPQKNFRGNIIKIAEVNQRNRFEKSGQWHENVDRSHLVLAGGKPVLQKRRKRQARVAASPGTVRKVLTRNILNIKKGLELVLIACPGVRHREHSSE